MVGTVGLGDQSDQIGQLDRGSQGSGCSRGQGSQSGWGG